MKYQQTSTNFRVDGFLFSLPLAERAVKPGSNLNQWEGEGKGILAMEFLTGKLDLTIHKLVQLKS